MIIFMHLLKSIFFSSSASSSFVNMSSDRLHPLRLTQLMTRAGDTVQSRSCNVMEWKGMGSDGKKCNLMERVKTNWMWCNAAWQMLWSKKIECRPMQLKPNVTLSYVTWYNMMLHGVTWFGPILCSKLCTRVFPTFLDNPSDVAGCRGVIIRVMSH